MLCNLELNTSVDKRELMARQRQSDSLGQEMQAAYYSVRKITKRCAYGMKMYGEMEI
jgi:hypothetical protein